MSLDGSSESNDTHRLSKSTGKGTYASVEHGLHCLAAAGVSFGISAVVSSASDFDDMQGFAQRLRELGASELELTLAMQSSGMFEPACHRPAERVRSSSKSGQFSESKR